MEKHNFHIRRFILILHPLRLTEQDYKKLRKDSNRAELTISDYLRKLINKQKIKPKPPDSYKDLVWEISKIGIDINKIANTASLASNDDAKTAVFLLTQIIKRMRKLG